MVASGVAPKGKFQTWRRWRQQRAENFSYKLQSQPMFRSEVLSLYRRIFRVAQQWQATTITETEAERQYIRDEARKLFRKNKDVSKAFAFQYQQFLGGI